MKKSEYKHIEDSVHRKNLIMFIEAMEEVLFYYSFESYKLPALNSHFLCLDMLQTKRNIDNRSITEGNFIPLAEEFEDMLDNDIVLNSYIPEVDILLKRRDKLGAIVDYRKAEFKAKISKYTEAASYICEISSVNNIYLTTIFDLLIHNIYGEKSEYSNWEKIYSLSKTLATELVNGGYSPEYIIQELKRMFLDKKRPVKCEPQILIDFFNRFTFQQKSYQVIFGINAETAQILKYIKDITVKTPSIDLKKHLELKHRGDRIVEVLVEDVDKHEAANSAYRYINTIIGLHRISQHHKPVYIKPLAQVNEINDELTVISTKVVRIGKNILLRANNENQIQSYFFDRQLLNSVNPPEPFFRAVSLHNNALDSKEPTNQLLDLWTAVETLIGFRSGDEDKINVVCDTLTSILNRAYLYSQIAQLHKDIAAVSEESCKNILTNVSGEESIVWKLAKILSVKTYQTEYNKLYESLDEYPLLQYRMELFSKKIFVNSETVYKELVRHRLKLRWQIMRIYRNRNMIVHSGKHMPYLNVILGNLHYYVDAMFDILIEYYHLGFEDNHNVFYHIQKEEMKHWDLLGLDEKGRKIKAQEITDTNYSAIIFNDYKGNAIKNIINQAIADMTRKNDVYTSEEIS